MKLKANMVLSSSLIMFIVFAISFTNLNARPIHYGAIDNEDLNLCDALQWKGKRQEAQVCYRQLFQASSDPLIHAEATWALGDIKTANSLFQAAVKSSPEDATIRIRWADLFMQTYQYQDALALFEEALALAPDNAYANIGAARALVERFESDARQYIDVVLADSSAAAGARFQAMLLMARMSMESTDMLSAIAFLNDAETLANSENLPQLEIYALFASMDLMDGKDNSDWISQALAENPAYGDIYAIPGYFFWVTRRYREAIDLFGKAVEVEPDHWVAHMEMGINLLRDNQVTRARQQMEIAYQGDPYNPKTVNTLRLLDTFDEYDLINSPEQPPADGFPRIIFRLHKDESKVLISYAEELAEQGIREFTERYQFEPKEPVIVEIYPNHDDFVVRTIGMPGVGILGATFGYVFAMDSPTDHADNEYHWGTTLWHELAHVFTLETTDHLIPRWFSEGISVFEEWRYGPIKGIRIPVNVLGAMAEDKFLPIAELDSGFIRPTYDEQVIVSYMQAGLICEYINRQFGIDKIVELLAAFKEGMETGPAIRKTLEISPSKFDDGFNDFVESEYGDLLGQLDTWKRHHQRALQGVAESEWHKAKESAEKALEIFPDYVESDSPYLFLAKANAELGDEQAELDTLMNFWQRGGYTMEAVWLLARKLYHRNNIDQAIKVLDSLNLVDPFDIDIHSTLGDWLLEEGKPNLALSEYQVALAMKPHDLAAAYYRVAHANHLLDDHDKARKNVLTALEIAPHYRPAQKLLLETIKTQ
ncbi:MAG: tetratricopeptide repeat protein [Gammaproteobacteria bacterium]